MERVIEYLRITPAYAAALGGLRWAADAEALERPDGSTFALSGEVVGFLEGFAAQRPLIHFAFILHLLHLLHQDPPAGEQPALGRAYREAGRVPRNAGVFCAVLCRDVPPVPEPPSGWEVGQRLTFQPITTTEGYLAAEDGTLHRLDSAGAGQAPPLAPEVFEAQLLRAASAYSHEDLLHWFKHGAGPVREAAQGLARAVLESRPASLRGLFTELGHCQRLAAAVPFVERLVSALSLPPRRLAPHELPVGGYSDVTMRGHPEQILPSQFALDDLEFVRRHCEHELLYFRREEPHRRTREELVVLLDQGVRTWGPVRLVLAGAVFAFARLAERRGLPFWVAATSAAGTPRDPLKEDRGRLAELLEASDLTPDPGLALERVLEEQTGPGRDVVLLTHPRNLAEPGVTAAARRAGPGIRLFAVTVDGYGEVQLSEVRHGSPVPLSRFRVDLSAAQPAPEPPAAEAAGPWSGDVEPVPFPFRFGPGGPGPGERPVQFDFDHAGEWLLAALSDGMLYATRTDGTESEVLPRPLAGGRVFVRGEKVLGVAGGFVVCGVGEPDLIAAHYDLRTRTCRVHRFHRDYIPGSGLAVWWYLRGLHTLVVRQPGGSQCIHLSTGDRSLTPACLPASPVITTGACEQVRLPLQGSGGPADPKATWSWPSLHFSPDEGSLSLRDVVPAWLSSFTPLSDGKPLLRGCHLVSASCQGKTLAGVFTREPGGYHQLHHFSWPGGTPVAQASLSPGLREFALSSDGRLLARQVKPMRLEVLETRPGFPFRFVTRVGQFHPDVALELGECWLTLQVDRSVHLVRWDQGRLEFVWFRGAMGVALGVKEELARARLPTEGVKAEYGRVPDFLNRVNSGRFRAAAWNRLVAVVSAFGEVAVFEPTGELVCMFFTFRQQIAAWMPDGTCHGPRALVGRGSTPGALDRMGKALWQAWERARRS
jgi:hypothetical protein